MRYLLDTNIVIFGGRSLDFQAYLDQQFSLFSADNRRLISVVTTAELLVYTKANLIGSKRLNRQMNLIGECQEIQISRDIIRAYAEIDLFGKGKHPNIELKGSHRIMGKNDLWIAATAIVTGAELITTDKDFIHLDGRFLKVHFIDTEKVLNS